jgi:hypothetical protein
MGNTETDRFILALSRCGGLFTASVRAAISLSSFWTLASSFSRRKASVDNQIFETENEGLGRGWNISG